MAVLAYGKHGFRASDPVAGHGQEQVGIIEAERSQRLKLDDCAILSVAGAARQGLRGTRPIVVLTPFGRVRYPMDVVGDDPLHEHHLLHG
jgi:hypothetical protein